MKEKILILVKTFPTPSKSYVETVCTAGLKEDGTWVRIFPIPYRCDYEKYSQLIKYRWVTCELYKAKKDTRPESYHLENDIFEFGDVLTTKREWDARRHAILSKAKIFTRKDDLLFESKNNLSSLAIFKPKSVKLICLPATNNHKHTLRRPEYIQGDLFDSKDWETNFTYVKPLPYIFKYKVTDADDKVSVYKILDWELGALFMNAKKRFGTDEEAREAVLKKYNSFLNEQKYDLYLYLGTLLQFHKKRVANPWTIIGVAPFPRKQQLEFNFDNI